MECNFCEIVLNVTINKGLKRHKQKKKPKLRFKVLGQTTQNEINYITFNLTCIYMYMKTNKV